jgi:hypothetical protein
MIIFWIVFLEDATWKALRKLYDRIPFYLFGWFFLYKFCRAFDGTSFQNKFNIPSFSQVHIYAKHRVFQTFSIWWTVPPSCRVFIFSIRKTIRTGKKEFNNALFINIFTVHLLETNFTYYPLPGRGYTPNKKCYIIVDIV